MQDMINKTYFNRRNYLLENSDQLNLSCEELLILIYIDFLQEFNQTIDYDILSKKTHLSTKKVNEIISTLQEKNYLEILFDNRQVTYNIDRVFTQEANQDLSSCSDIILLFEQAMAKPLSNHEVGRIRDLLAKYDVVDIQQALNRAISYEKVSIDYVEAILRSNYEK